MVKVKIDYCQKNKMFGNIKTEKANSIFVLEKKNFLVFILASLVCLSGIVYVYQINKTATLGYEIKEKEEAIAKLKEENRKMEIESAQFKSVHIAYASQADKNVQSDEKKDDSRILENEEKGNNLKENIFEDEFLKGMSKPENVSFMEVEVERNVVMK